jgi:hypothetical protein
LLDRIDEKRMSPVGARKRGLRHWCWRGRGRFIPCAAGFLMLASGLAGCGDTGTPIQPPDSLTLTLLPESALVSSCFGWPGQDFTLSNHAIGDGPSVTVGGHAIEFTLLDHSGTEHKLSELLRTRPVLMVFGGFT